MAASHIRRIPVFLRMTDFGAEEVTFRNQPVGERSFIVRNQPVILDICLFHDANSAEIMTKEELENIGCHGWTLNISKNHALMYPVFIQPDYADTENPPITVAENGVISVRLDITDTQESADAISGMQADMWEAELAGFGEDDTALEHPSFVFQWSIGYVNRVASENADAPGLLEATYYTKEQVNSLLDALDFVRSWGDITGDIADQTDLKAVLDGKASVPILANVPPTAETEGEVGRLYIDLAAKKIYHCDGSSDNEGTITYIWTSSVSDGEKGVANGIATLDSTGKLTANQLPILQLSSPPTTSTVGSVGQLAVWHDADNNKNHLYHLCFISTSDSATLYHWEECVLVSMGNVAGGYPVLDENGKVASEQLPIASYNTQAIGAIYSTNMSGIELTLGGEARLVIPSNAITDARSQPRYPVVLSNLNYAVRSVIPLVTEIPAATSDYSLVDSSATTNNHSHVYSHSPSSTAPTYRLPQVTNTTIAHYIELTVDFTAVQTYSFLDHAGEPIVPLFTPAIAAGDVYTFKCEYSAIKGSWLIYPQKQGAVADDFVMRGEVGAANGVAPLDSNGIIPSANIPVATDTVLGGVKVRESFGIKKNSQNALLNVFASENDINLRGGYYHVINPPLLNYAVTAAITDANHITLTDAQKATAQSVFGVGGAVTSIPAATSQYTLAEGIFKHTPANAPTYTVPDVSDTIRLHEIILMVDFADVQSLAFIDSQEATVPVQINDDIELGDTVCFLLRYMFGEWKIIGVKL